MEDDRVAIIEAQLAQAKQIADEADRKYEEVKFGSSASVSAKSHRLRKKSENIFELSIPRFNRTRLPKLKRKFKNVFVNSILRDSLLSIFPFSSRKTSFAAFSGTLGVIRH